MAVFSHMWRGLARGGLAARGVGVVLLVCFAFVTLAPRAKADGASDHVLDLARMNDLIEMMREEGIRNSLGSVDQLLPPGNAGEWHQKVARIYDGERMGEAVRSRFSEAVAGQDLSRIETFLTSELGKKMLENELRARRLLTSDKVYEQAALGAYEQKRRNPDQRLELMRQMVEGNDLVEQNLVGSLNANLAFLEGLAVSEGDLPNEEMLMAHIIGESEKIREQTEDWIYAFVIYAYQDFSDDEIRQYLAVMRTPENRLYVNAMMSAFNRMRRDLSYALGVAAGEIRGRGERSL